MIRFSYHGRDYAPITPVMQVPYVIGSVKTHPASTRTVGERIRTLREHRGLTQQALADKVGVSQGTIANLESGFRKSPRALLAIADSLGAPPHWIESCKGPNPVEDSPTGQAHQSPENAHPLIHPSASMFTPSNLSAAIYLMAKLLSRLDKRSRHTMGQWLAELAANPEEEAPDIAYKAEGLAARQRISSNDDLNRLFSGRSEPVETRPAKLDT